LFVALQGCSQSGFRLRARAQDNIEMNRRKPVKPMPMEELKRRVQGLKNAPKEVHAMMSHHVANPLEMIETAKARGLWLGPKK